MNRCGWVAGRDWVGAKTWKILINSWFLQPRELLGHTPQTLTRTNFSSVSCLPPFDPQNGPPCLESMVSVTPPYKLLISPYCEPLLNSYHWEGHIPGGVVECRTRRWLHPILDLMVRCTSLNQTASRNQKLPRITQFAHEEPCLGTPSFTPTAAVSSS